jgi:hypothetical protein
MARLISSKDLLAEGGYSEPKGTVTISGLDIPRDIEPLRKTKKIDLENLNPELQDRIARMQEDWRNNKELNPKGLELPITRAASTAAEQQDLIRRNAAGEPGIYTPAPVPPGAKMVHQNAIDLPTSVPDSFLAQYGLHRPLIKKGDPVHVQIDPNAAYEVPSFQGISSADLLKQAESLTPEQGQPQQNKVYSPLDVMTAALSRIGLGQTVAPQEVKPNTMLEKLLGGIEAAGSMATGAVTAIPSAMAYGYVPKGSQPSAYEEAKKRSELISQFQYKPQTQTGQNLAEMLGNAPKAILGTSAPLPPMLGVESQLLGRMGYEKPPAINAPKMPSKYALTEPALQRVPEMPANVTPISTLSGVGAAEANLNPYAGKFTGESVGRGELYPQIKNSKIAGDVPVNEQQLKAEVLQDVLKDSKQIRPGVITGNEDTLRMEYNEAKRADKSPAGQILKEQIVNEQNALTNYALERIQNTGASRLLNTPEKRGYAMNNAVIGRFDPKTGEFEGMLGFIQKLKHDVYEAGRKKVGDNPVESTNFQNQLNNPDLQDFLKAKGSKDFTEGVQGFLTSHKTRGFNQTKPNSINGLEEIRKSLNALRDEKNSYVVGKLINAIDEDIAAVGGAGSIEKGRQIHALEKTIFGSEGMKIDKIFGTLDANGVKKGTPTEKITQKLNDLPLDQWKHIYDTADKVSKGKIQIGNMGYKIPQDVIDQANQLKNEMKGAIAREVYEQGEKKIGVWNQNSANAAMNSLGDKITYAFSPEEQLAFNRLNLAGQWMPGIHSYEGGPMQAERMGLLKTGINKLPFLGGALAGSATKGAGTGVGVAAGEAGQNLLLRNLSKKDAQKMQETMKSNYNLGNLMELKKGNEQ